MGDNMRLNTAIYTVCAQEPRKQASIIITWLHDWTEEMTQEICLTKE